MASVPGLSRLCWVRGNHSGAICSFDILINTLTFATNRLYVFFIQSPSVQIASEDRKSTLPASLVLFGKSRLYRRCGPCCLGLISQVLLVRNVRRCTDNGRELTPQSTFYVNLYVYNKQIHPVFLCSCGWCGFLHRNSGISERSFVLESCAFHI